MRDNWPPGVRAVYGFPSGSRKAGRGASEIQSLLFEKDKWTPSKARRWLESRGFKYGKMDPGGERADYYHFRQTEPSGFARMRVSTNPGSLSDLPFSRKEPDLRQVEYYIPTMEEWTEIQDLPRYTMRELFIRPDQRDMLQDFKVEVPQLFVMETSFGDVLVDTRGYNYARYMLLISREK